MELNQSLCVSEYIKKLYFRIWTKGGFKYSLEYSFYLQEFINIVVLQLLKTNTKVSAGIFILKIAFFMFIPAIYINESGS